MKNNHNLSLTVNNASIATATSTSISAIAVSAEEINTFKDLLAAMPSTMNQKVPTAKALAESAEVFLQTDSITVYNNGFFVYTADDYSTVFAVDRCKTMAFYHGASRYEESIRATIGGCECHYLMRNTVLQAVIPVEVFENLDWSVVLTIIGENRLEYNTFIRHIRKNSREINDRNDSLDEIENHAAGDENADWITLEMIEAVKEARRSLTKSQEEIVHLYFDLGMSNKEIAARLGITKGAVTQRISSALNRLRKKFSRIS